MEFSVGNTLATSVRIWLRNFLPFTLLNALLHLPILVWLSTKLQGEYTLDNAQSISNAVAISSWASVATGLFLTGAVTYGVVMELDGRRAPMVSCLRVGLSRMVPTLGITVLFMVCVLVGLVLLVLPGLAVASTLYVAVPAAIVERPRWLGSFSRSSELTRGFRIQILGLLIVVWGGLLLLEHALEKAYLQPVASSVAMMSHVRSYVYVTSMVGIITGVLAAVVPAVAYAQLRYSKDGTRAGDLATVFG